MARRIVVKTEIRRSMHLSAAEGSHFTFIGFGGVRLDRVGMPKASLGGLLECWGAHQGGSVSTLVLFPVFLY